MGDVANVRDEHMATCIYSREDGVPAVGMSIIQHRQVKSLQLTAYGQEIMRTHNARRVQRVQQVIVELPGETRC